MAPPYTILTYSTFMWFSPLQFCVSNQKALLLLPDSTLKQNEFQGVLILCQCLYIVSLKRGNIWKQFSMYLGDSQTISWRRINQNAWGLINKSESRCMSQVKFWIIPALSLSSFSHCVVILMCMCFYIPACACVLYMCVCSDCHHRALYHHKALCA